MLCEAIGCWRNYDFGPAWSGVMSWIEQHAAGSAEGFETTLSGCRIGVSGVKTKTLDCALFESHRVMADVHVILDGEEWMYIAPSTGLAGIDPYDEARDIIFHVTPPSETARLTLRPGVFALVFPWDAHMPLVAVEGRVSHVRKLVAKIPMDMLTLGQGRRS